MDQKLAWVSVCPKRLGDPSSGWTKKWLGFPCARLSTARGLGLQDEPRVYQGRGISPMGNPRGLGLRDEPNVYQGRGISPIQVFWAFPAG